MSSKEHLTRLKDTIAAKNMTGWNHWRQENQYIPPDLSRSDLSEAFLGGANLTKANVAGTNLAEAHLAAADLTGAKELLQMQIDEANGNKDTKLPQNLRKPINWA